MTWRTGRWTVAIAAAAAIAADAGPIAVDVANGDEGVPASGSRVFALSITGSRDANRVRVDYDGAARYTIFDAAGVVGCDPIDARTASCYSTNPHPDISFVGNGGDDTAVFAASVPGVITAVGANGDDHFEIEPGGQARARFRGWFRGADTLIGGARHDSLLAGVGTDRVIARGGPDRLYGGRGADVLRGGRGNDHVNALGHDPDRSIRCGPGEDVALVDPADPAPRGCERVRRR